MTFDTSIQPTFDGHLARRSAWGGQLDGLSERLCLERMPVANVQLEGGHVGRRGPSDEPLLVRSGGQGGLDVSGVLGPFGHQFDIRHVLGQAGTAASAAAAEATQATLPAALYACAVISPLLAASKHRQNCREIRRVQELTKRKTWEYSISSLPWSIASLGLAAAASASLRSWAIDLSCCRVKRRLPGKHLAT